MTHTTHFRGLATKHASLAISASKYSGKLVNEFFTYLEDITLSPGYLKGWRIFLSDCCHLCTENPDPSKNSCSRQIRIVNAVVTLIAKLKLLILRQWWQLWMKSAAIKQRYGMNLFFEVFCLIVLLPNSMSKLIHNWCKLTSKASAAYVCSNEQLGRCFYVLVCYPLLFSYEIILKQLFASGSVNIVE